MSDAIVPKPCGRWLNRNHWPTHCGDKFLGSSDVARCSQCTTLGDRLRDLAFTAVTDARDAEGILFRAMASLSWNLTLAALLTLAREA